MCHQQIGVKIPSDFVKYNNKEMPHSMHSELMPCIKCHEQEFKP